MHVDIDWRNVKGYLKICDWVGLKTVNQSAEFFKKLYLFKELYLKKNEVNQPDICMLIEIRESLIVISKNLVR